MSLTISSTSPSHWKYISEGGASIVFSYVGPAHPYFDCTALRLRKIHNQDRGVDAPDVAEEPDDPTILFQHQIIQQLIPAEHLPRLESVNVTRAWLEELRTLTEERRPAERRAKDAIDVNRRKAVLATDLVGGNILAVEIKPKWGFLPSPDSLPLSSVSVKTTTCRFCMHSHLKRTQGEEVASGYCPLDLFSGDTTRVLKALQILWDNWIGSSGAVNNLRVFVDGAMVQPSITPSSLAPLAVYLCAERDAAELSLTALRDAFTDAVLPLLIGTPVLRTLSTLQRTLDPLDIQGLTALWYDAHRSIHAQAGVGSSASVPVPPIGAGLAEPTLSDWQAFLDIYRATHASMDHSHPDAANIKYYCMAYLLSASFKDCSIILRIPRAKDISGTVTVIDLDVKPVDRLEKWAKLDAEILEAYKGLPDPKTCVDRWAHL